MVGASVQYIVNRETRDVRLQSFSAKTRSAVLQALNHIQIPSHLSRLDLLSMFGDTFRVILPDTLNLERKNSAEAHVDENEMDALDILCARLTDRQIIHRVSDREVMYSISNVTRNIELLDDPRGQFSSSRPRVFVVNCRKCHFAGETQLKMAKIHNFQVCFRILYIYCDVGRIACNFFHYQFPARRESSVLILFSPQMDSKKGSEIPLPPDSICGACGDSISIMREVLIASNTWDLFKPLGANADTINVERHLPSQFQILPPKVERGNSFHLGYGNILSEHGQKITGTELSSPLHPQTKFFVSCSSCCQSFPHDISSPSSPGFGKGIETAQTSLALDDITLRDGIGCIMASPTEKVSQQPLSSEETPVSSEPSFNREASQSRLRLVSSVSFVTQSLVRSGTVPLITPPGKGKSRWRSKLTTSRKESKTSDSSSLSSTTFESQKLEEIPLASLMSSSKMSLRGKSAKTVNVSLSQNSTYALFWTQASINIWDYGNSTSILGRTVLTEGNIVLVAVTKLYLVYIAGTRGQKLSVRLFLLIYILMLT